MANQVILTEQERALVVAWRTFRAYQEQRLRGHKLLDDPKDAEDEACWFEQFADGSGSVRVDPADPNDKTFNAAAWTDLLEAAPAIAKATVHLKLRIDQIEQGKPRFGNPRRGRPAPKKRPS
ncbi:MAG: hypothetical protein EPN91_12350 [Salinibacterium sp.]|nr:MAG: hypothetical protein EPN91_12350 [Salinibacterium sp.]